MLLFIFMKGEEMIFSKQQMETAFAYSGIYFDKILLVNFVEDSFTPIKVNDREWRKIPSLSSFSDWVKGFIKSDMYRTQDVTYPYYNLASLANIEGMSKLTAPMFFSYQKIIDCGWHDVQAELYPIGSGLAYLFVRDITKIQEGIMPEKED